MTVFQVAPEQSVLCATVHSSLHSIERSGRVSGHLDATDTGSGPATPTGGELLLDLTTMKSSDPLYDRELESRLDVDRYPRVTARLLEVTPDGEPGAYRMTGELTFHGRTNTVSGVASVIAVGDQLRLNGSLTLDIREFGIEPPKLLMLKVRPTVDVALELLTVRSAAAPTG